jgi:hypothetical protein
LCKTSWPPPLGIDPRLSAITLRWGCRESGMEHSLFWGTFTIDLPDTQE